MPRTHRSLWLCTFLVVLAVATLALPPPAHAGVRVAIGVGVRSLRLPSSSPRRPPWCIQPRWLWPRRPWCMRGASLRRGVLQAPVSPLGTPSLAPLVRMQSALHAWEYGERSTPSGKTTPSAVSAGQGVFSVSRTSW